MNIQPQQLLSQSCEHQLNAPSKPIFSSFLLPGCPQRAKLSTNVQRIGKIAPQLPRRDISCVGCLYSLECVYSLCSVCSLCSVYSSYRLYSRSSVYRLYSSYSMQIAESQGPEQEAMVGNLQQILSSQAN